jgi:hypothetical protein
MRAHPVILFLDFDGVLHAAGGGPPRRHLEKLPLLEALLREPGLSEVGIVVSSTWRVIQTAAQLRCLFAPDLRERVAGCTPQLERHRTPYRRHEEIAAWLAAHPEVRDWVALDDDVRGFPPDAGAHAVFTQSEAALGAHDIEVLRARLLAAARA